MPDVPTPIREPDDFALLQSDLKNYPHFDERIGLKEANILVRDPKRVAQNAFFPFMLYHEEWQPFRTPKGALEKPEPKVRPIRYASRRDAYIFTYYRRILAEAYESRLTELGIDECPIAYRRLTSDDARGKCNIDFARDAFQEIKQLGNCVAVAMDIKGYFENLDHERIKTIWCNLLNCDCLPADHYAIFKNITRYHVVDIKDVYRRLGYIETTVVDGVARDVYTVPFREMPKQLCSTSDFRKRICGGDPTLPSLIRGNVDGSGDQLTYGIPQGAPISDVIANFYLIDFDKRLYEFVSGLGGYYRRYSDDILLIVPGAEQEASRVENFVSNEIRHYGDRLEIKDSKTCVTRFSRSDSHLDAFDVKSPKNEMGFEYLGFRFDGKKVLIRESNISRLHRKIAKSAIGFAKTTFKRNQGRPIDDIISSVNYSLFSSRYMRVPKDKLAMNDHGTWTFYTYAKRAERIFGSDGAAIPRQLAGVKSFMRDKVEKRLRKFAAREN